MRIYKTAGISFKNTLNFAKSNVINEKILIKKAGYSAVNRTLAFFTVLKNIVYNKQKKALVKRLITKVFFQIYIIF